LNHNLVKD
jgi:hypothetical protein